MLLASNAQWGYNKAGTINFNLSYTQKCFAVVKTQTTTNEGWERRITQVTLNNFLAYQNVNEYYYWISVGV